MSDDQLHRFDEPDHHGVDPDPEIRPRLVVQLIVVLTVVTVVFAVAVWPLVKAFARDEPAAGDRPSVDVARPSGPLLQSEPIAELEQLRHREDSILESYGWSDEAARLARVPVRRAMEMVLEEGVGALTIEAVGASPSAGSAGDPVAEDVAEDAAEVVLEDGVVEEEGS